MKSDSAYNSQNIIRIKGVTDGHIESLGTIETNLFFENYSLPHTFHVVSNEFNIPADGILGKDFIKPNLCEISYRNMTLTVPINNEDVIIPILQGPEQDTIVLPARCEVIRRFNIGNQIDPQIIQQQELESGIFIARTIVNPEMPYARVLNTGNETKIIKINDVKHEPLSDYHVYSIDPIRSSNQRLIDLMNIIKENSPETVFDDLSKLCSSYSDVFALESDKMTVNNFYTQHLRLLDDKPVYAKNYRLPQTQKAEIDRQVKKLLENDLIEPSQSSYNSPIILVPKKSTDGEKKWRMCIDYRLLNKKLVPDKFPLPRIDEILDQLGRAKFFSILDLFSGFHQIPIDDSSREITSFSASSGAFQWKVLPFGLNVAPNSFMRMMHIAFSGLESHIAFLYMDDIIVVGCSEEHHLKNLKSIFDVCRKFNLKLNPLKCQFFKNEVVFLGHKCTSNGIMPDQSKINAVVNYPRPMSKEEVKRFTAFSNYYRRFVPNFAKLAHPLNKLTRKDSDFHWTDDCEKSFIELKRILSSPPLLQFPDFSKPFVVTVDASNFACGAVLSQNFDENDLPICYISRTFKKGEINKSTIEKELMAIHFAITQLRPYLFGRHFTVRSDHRPLIYLYKLKDPASKLTRIRLELEEYDFDIIHIKGKNNVAADALPRIKISDLKQIYDESVPVYAVQTRSMTRKPKTDSDQVSNTIINSPDNSRIPNVIEELDSHFVKSIPRIRTNPSMHLYAFKKRKILMKFDMSTMAAKNEMLTLESVLSRLEKEAAKIQINKFQWPINDNIFSICSVEDFKNACIRTLKTIQIILINPPKIIEDNKEKFRIMTEFHCDPLVGGHCGQKKLYFKLRSKYYWKGMSRDIARFVRNCQKCQLNKVKIGQKEPMTITNTPQKPFDVVIVDTVGPLPKSLNDNQYILTLICDLTKFLIAIPLADKSAKTIARAIFEHFVLIYGPMKSIRTDRGTEYRNELITELCKLLKIEHTTSTAYRHQSVGSIERNHRVLNEYLRSYVSDNLGNWEEYLRYFVFCYNTSNSIAFEGKFTPFELVYSKKANLPEELLSGRIDPIYNIENFVLEAKYRLQIANDQASKLLNKLKQRNKIIYDKNCKPLEIDVNKPVLLQKQPYDKFKPIYDGPYEIINIDGSNVKIRNKRTKKEQVVHKDRLRVTNEIE